MVLNELEELPDIDEPMPVPPPVADKAPKKQKKRKRDEAKPEKDTLIASVLENWDSKKQGDVPNVDELKRKKLSDLKVLAKTQQIRQSSNLNEKGLAETFIAFLSSLLDTALQTDGEIERTNMADQELIRALREELGYWSSLLNNKVKVAAHLALNSGKVAVKKFKTNPQQSDGPKGKIAGSAAEPK